MTHSNHEDLSGQTFGRLKVLRPTAGRSAGCVIWHCLCSCGAETMTRSDRLRSGTVQSCGCLAREVLLARCQTHGATVGRKFAAEYVCWANMMRRCYDPTVHRFERYGGRGITVCDRWKHYANFLADIGPKPSPSHSIERNNNNGNYEPANCRWATRAEQARNRRTNRLLTHNGRTMCLLDWAKAIGREPSTIRNRIQRGLSIEHVLAEQKLHR